MLSDAAACTELTSPTNQSIKSKYEELQCKRMSRAKQVAGGIKQRQSTV
jgi:hypothetical protein